MDLQPGHRRGGLEFGSVRVVAPDVERSSMGHAITATRPLWYRATSIHGLDAYSRERHARRLCALGAHHWDEVDLVLSGLNIGLNLGNSIWHSGTLAAAKQAALHGIVRRRAELRLPAPSPTSTCKPWIRRVLQVLLEEADPPLVNVNFPRTPKGMVWTRASIRQPTAAWFPPRTRWDGSATGSPSRRSSARRRARIAGRWSRGGCR
ncbi:MAG: 5'/3'-nucleotidase SurE [Vicinamibacterales bacterium]